MSIFKYFRRLQYIDFLIQRKATGDQKTFARKNNLSTRGLAKVIEDMKEMGFPIKFDKARKCYYYTKEGHMPQTLFIERESNLSRGDLRENIPMDVTNVCFSEEKIFKSCT